MLKIEVGKTYKNEEGRQFRVLGERKVSCLLVPPFVTLSMTGEGSEVPYYHHQDGKSPLSPRYNLVSEYREPDYRWFNVYQNCQPPSFHNSLANARYGMLTKTPLVGTYRIDLITGDILKEES